MSAGNGARCFQWLGADKYNNARLVYWQGGLFLCVRCEALCDALSGILGRGSIGALWRRKIDYRGFQRALKANACFTMCRVRPWARLRALAPGDEYRDSAPANNGLWALLCPDSKRAPQAATHRKEKPPGRIRAALCYERLAHSNIIITGSSKINIIIKRGSPPPTSCPCGAQNNNLRRSPLWCLLSGANHAPEIP